MIQADWQPVVLLANPMEVVGVACHGDAIEEEVKIRQGSIMSWHWIVKLSEILRYSLIVFSLNKNNLLIGEFQNP